MCPQRPSLLHTLTSSRRFSPVAYDISTSWSKRTGPVRTVCYMNHVWPFTVVAAAVRVNLAVSFAGHIGLQVIRRHLPKMLECAVLGYSPRFKYPVDVPGATARSPLKDTSSSKGKFAKLPKLLTLLKISSVSVRLQTVNGDFITSANIDPTVGHSWHSEFDRVARGIAGTLCAIPKFIADVCSIVSMEDRGTICTAGSSVLAVVEGPDDAITGSTARGN